MKKIFLALALGFAVASCQKDASGPGAVNNNVENFTQLKVADSFDWSTTKKITLNLEKVVNATNRPSLLTVKDTEGHTLIKQMVRMDQDGSIDFVAPSKTKTLEVTYGITTKEVSVTGTQGTFDFLPVLDDSDLD